MVAAGLLCRARVKLPQISTGSVKMNRYSSGRSLDECNCACHNPRKGTKIMHCVACCRQCPYCKTNISSFAFDEHEKRCEKNHIFDTEIAYFNQHRKEWFDHHADKISLVHGTTLYGFYDNYDDALKVGYDKLGLVPFLLKEVLLQDRVEWL